MNPAEGKVMTKDQIKAITAYIKKSVRIDASNLSDADKIKLCEFILSAFSLDTPSIVAQDRKELGL